MLHSSDEEQSEAPIVSIMPPLPSLEDVIDSDAHLSDLDDDIKKYIATKKEVGNYDYHNIVVWLLSVSFLHVCMIESK